MPQTGTTKEHAHLYEDGGSHTTVTNGHWHRRENGKPVTGPAIPVGSERELSDGHRHTQEG